MQAGTARRRRHAHAGARGALAERARSGQTQARERAASKAAQRRPTADLPRPPLRARAKAS
eukprot:5185263-Pleurochrysis_carterae.AAC.1